MCGRVWHERVLDIVSKASRQRVQSGGKEKGMKRKRGCVGDEGRGPASARQRSLNLWQPTSPCVWEAKRPFTAPCPSVKPTVLQSFGLPPFCISRPCVLTSFHTEMCLWVHEACSAWRSTVRVVLPAGCRHHFRETRQKLRES